MTIKSGREQHEELIRTQVSESLDGYPILQKYFKEGAGSQMTTKQVFINTIKRLIDYLRETKSRSMDHFDDWEVVNKRDIKDFLDYISVKKNKDGVEKKLSNKTLNDYNITIRNFFKYLINEEVIVKNPAPSKSEVDAMFITTTAERKATAMSIDEVKEIKDFIIENSNSPKMDICMFMLGCRTGLRAQALSEIDIDKINFDKRIITVIEKNHKERTIHLGSDSIQLIKNYIEQERQPLVENVPEGYMLDPYAVNALFLRKWSHTHRVERVTRYHLTYLFKHVKNHFGKNFHPHTMRATAATNSYKKTGNIYKTAELIGHNSINTTMRYIDDVEGKKEMADMMDDMY